MMPRALALLLARRQRFKTSLRQQRRYHQPPRVNPAHAEAPLTADDAVRAPAVRWNWVSATWTSLIW